MSRALKLAELRRLKDDELVRLHDDKAQTTDVGLNYYLSELARRDYQRATVRMLAYTRRMTWMTVVITLATLVNVALIAVTLCS